MVVYITTNLINGIKYIGKDSKNDPKYLGSGTLLLEEIKLYGRENFTKEVIEYCKNNEILSIRESFWINKYKAVESNEFYNLVDFSAGWNLEKSGKEKYNYICNRIKNSTMGIKRPNLSQNQIRKDKLSIANKGISKPIGFGKTISEIKLLQNIKMSNETKQKISIAKKNHPMYQNQSYKERNFKSIIQYDLNMNKISEFKSIKEASEFNSKFKHSNISCCLTGVSKTAYGFIWKYKTN